MKHQKKFQSQVEEQQATDVQSQQKTSAHEFGSVEDLLRYDAKQTTVPPGIAQRIGRSLRHEPHPARSWWRRFFGGI